jgi:hypothetical protein
MLTATAAICQYPAVSSVVAAGKFKVATPDVSALYEFLQCQETVVLFYGKHIKVKAFSTSLVNPVAAFVAAVPLVKNHCL